MPKHFRREDSESGEEVPQPKKNWFELASNLQNEVVVGLIASNITPDRDLLQSIKIEFLFIGNLHHLVLPHWLSELSSLKEIVIEGCKEFKQELADEGSFPFYDFKLRALIGITFRGCKKIYVNSFSKWAPNLKTVKFDNCDWADISGKSSDCGFEYIHLNHTSFKNLDWVDSSPATKRLHVHYNAFYEIPSQFRNMSQLEHVNLFLDIEKIPKISTMWPNVRVLSLNLTSTARIEEGTFEELQYLENLTIKGGAKVGSLQQIASIPNLEDLFLENVCFDSTDIFNENPFQKLKNLQVRTSSQPFPRWIHLCRNLRSLTLHGTPKQLQALPEYLNKLDQRNDIDLVYVYQARTSSLFS